MSAITKALQQLPIDKYGDIRFAKERLNQRVPGIKPRTAGDRIWFLDAPEYGNLGDQAIAYAIQRFCTDNFPERELLEFQEDSVLQYLGWLKKNIDPSDVIILQGGGNLGNIYPRYEYIRRNIVRDFPNNKIIIFPQSVSFSKDSKGSYEKSVFSEVYGKHKKLILFARDSHSLKVIQKYIPEADVRLCPDIVLYLTGEIESQKRRGLGACLRQDSEKSVSDEDVESIIAELKKKYSSCRQITTLCEEEKPIVGDLRKQLVREKLNEFASLEIILTDRLHGMIFSYITSTPCIALDNMTGKSSYAYNDWLRNSKNVVFLKQGKRIVNLPENAVSQKLNFDDLKNAFND